MASLITPFNEEAEDETQVESTEDLQAAVEEFNDKEVKEKVELYSMDAKALYPSITIKKSAEAVYKIMTESKIKVENVNYLELARYMAHSFTVEEQENLGIKDMVMQRKNKGGRRPKVTGREMANEWDDKESIWLGPVKEPDDEEKRKLLALAVGREVELVMRNHLFRFRGKVYKQDEGGAIGSELTCVVARTRMIMFMREMKRKVAELEGIRMFLAKVYVDDTALVSTSIERGWRYDKCEGKLVWTQAWSDEDFGVASDVRTARVMVDVANSLDEDIQMTFDCPSSNGDGKMPVLDLKMWMCDEEGVKKVKFCFYEKPMAAKVTVLKESALSWRVKKMALSGEVCRRYLNCSKDIVEEGGAEVHVDWFCWKMLKSGYNREERDEIVCEGKARYSNLLAKVTRGERPLYRSKTWMKEERGVEKIRKRKGWHGGADTVLFVQSTPKEMLRREVQEVMNKLGMKVKVVEKGGRSLKSLLQRSDVEPSPDCKNDDCVVCRTEAKGLCSMENVGYMVWCKECEMKGVRTVMHGETGRCARIRCGEHERAYLSKKNSNLWEHARDVHKGGRVEYGYKVDKTFKDDVLARQLDEAIRIAGEDGYLMNDKNEWVRPAGVSISINRM